MRCEDITNKIFTYLRVIEKVKSPTGRSAAYWRCYCKCGNERVVKGENLRDGTVKSCGCRKKSEDILRRIFDKKYDILSNGCWEWKGGRNQDGYPNLGDKGRKAHRYSYERFKGKIPEKICVYHTCDNRGCVNPRHLFLGTPAQNNEDKIQKNRQAKGEKSGQSKLKEKDVQKIRLEYADTKVSTYFLAKKYGVSQAVIWNVIRRKTWKHVE